MISLLGIIVILLAAYALSFNRKAINWRTVAGAFSIQAGIGLLILYFPAGKEFLEWIANIREINIQEVKN